MGNNLKQLKNQLKELKLKHLAAQFDDFMISACNGEKPNTQFLMDALEIELSERRRLSMEKRLKYAKFPVFDKPFDLNGFDFGKRQGVSKRQILGDCTKTPVFFPRPLAAGQSLFLKPKF